jgi:predicted thioesterase
MRDTCVDVVRETQYLVVDDDSVRQVQRRGPEFQRKPEVMASARILEVCEDVCMDALAPILQPGECSLGSLQAAHWGPIAIGALLTIRVQCTVFDGCRSLWEVVVHDGHEIVYQGTLGFVVKNQARFERTRLRPKLKTSAR